MAPPPLSPDERRLGTFALASSALYAASGLFFAVLPHLTLRIAAANEPITFGPGARMWHTLSISMMAMLSMCCYFAGRAPREGRRFLLPVLLSKALSTGVAALTLLSWRAAELEGGAGRRTLWATITTDFPLLLATAYFFWKAAPGVNAEAQAPAPALPEGPKPVALGLSRATAPAEPAAAKPPTA